MLTVHTQPFLPSVPETPDGRQEVSHGAGHRPLLTVHTHPFLPYVPETPDSKQEVSHGAGQSQPKGEAWEPWHSDVALLTEQGPCSHLASTHVAWLASRPRSLHLVKDGVKPGGFPGTLALTWTDP